MKVVQPIRDKRKVEQIKQYLKQKNERDYLLFFTGINIGLRISDILPFQVTTVKGTHIDIIEKKTGKRKIIKINRQLRKALDEYTAGMSDDEYLFKSRNIKHISGDVDMPITTSMAYKILKEASRACGVPDIGTHSLRKTFGYHFYRETKDIVLLMELFNHEDQKDTLRYIGIIQDTLDSALDRFSL